MTCGDPDHMEEPVTCDWCSEWGELQEMNFFEDENNRKVCLCDGCYDDAIIYDTSEA